MKRDEIIYKILKEMSSKITLEDLDNTLNIGFSAEDIAGRTNIPRNIVSQELNILNKTGRAIKIKSRPVLFIEINVLEKLLGKKIERESFEIKSMSEIIDRDRKMKIVNIKATKDNPFHKLIGYNGSLSIQIKQAESAVMYPPNGLHVLLTGPSGVGKTYFAQLMHEYAIKEGDFSENTPFIYFNCSEYSNNPELLSAQLFGYKKGAFTGASDSSDGLIMKANSGFLFLDEIHRLSNEGQEKLFSVLDKGKLRKLGDSGKETEVNIRLIGATTSDPDNTFLKTFLRRIHVIISIPSLNERTLEERLEMVLKFLKSESVKTNLKIKIDYATLYYLLDYKCEGNIGQLKNDLQFMCAQAYLDVIMKDKDCIEISNAYLSLEKTNKDINIEKILSKLNWDSDFIQIKPFGSDKTENAKKLQENFYEVIETEYGQLNKRNFSYEDSKKIITTKLKRLFNQMFIMSKQKNDDSISLIPEQIKYKIQKVVEMIEKVIETSLNDSVINGLYLHIYSIISNIKKGKSLTAYDSIDVKYEYPAEYVKAEGIRKYIADIFNIDLPENESMFLTLFINAAINSKPNLLKDKKLAIFLIVHGETTATSMAEFANKVFESKIVYGINMPFDQSVTKTLEILIEQIKLYGFKEIILMVDMGSLVYFGDIIEKELGVKIVAIQNVTTLMVLEVAKNVLFTELNMEQICDKLSQEELLKNIVVKSDSAFENKERIIITSCITGTGTSDKIKKLIQDTFNNILPKDIKIITKDYHSIDTAEKLEKEINRNQIVIGIVGTFNINIPNIPFISLEELFSEDGIEKLMEIIDLDKNIEDLNYLKAIEDISKKFIKSITLQSIIDYLTILNPEKIISEIEEALEQICDTLGLTISKQKRLRFLIHSCCMVERLMTSKSEFEYQIPEEYRAKTTEVSVIKESFNAIQKIYNIELIDRELYCLYELIIK